MPAIKRTPADIAFSKCNRERSNWTCERCGAIHDESSKGLHCSHYHGRGKWGTRFDPDNCEALCYGCHSFLEQHPHEHEKRERERLGDTLYEIVREKSQDTGLGRAMRKTKGKGEIARHYREEFLRMQSLRGSGITGRIEFDGYLP